MTPFTGNGDPGLQPQRTALAWNRTGLAVFANALLVLRTGAHGAHGNHPALLLAGWVLLGGAVAMMACGAWRRHQLMQGTALGAPPQAVVLTALAVSGLACGFGAWSVCVSLP